MIGCRQEAPPTLLKRGAPIGIATYAGNVTITTHGEDDSHSQNVRLSHFIAQQMYLNFGDALKLRKIANLPNLHKEDGNLDGSHLAYFSKKDSSGLINSDVTATYVTAHTSIPLVSPGDRGHLALLANSQHTTVLLWIVNSYSWNVGEWWDFLPLVKSKWQFTIKTTVIFISSDGTCLWKKSFTSNSAIDEWGAGRNYYFYSHSKIENEQALALINSAIAANTAQLVGIIESVTGA
jgi:hypothetical protein